MRVEHDMMAFAFKWTSMNLKYKRSHQSLLGLGGVDAKPSMNRNWRSCFRIYTPGGLAFGRG